VLRADAAKGADDADFEIRGIEAQEVVRDARQQTLKLGRRLLAQLDG
jgi:hypothetical protein